MNTIERFLVGLLDTNKVLTILYEDHLQENDELLPHVFFGDVTRYIMQLAVSSTSDHRENASELLRILRFFESSYRESDEKIKNILFVSFLENLEQSDPSYSIIKAQLGDEMKRKLDQIESFYS